MHEATPLEFEAVFNKRGSDWTPKEKYEVLRWLYTHKLRYLLVFALLHLSRYATREEEPVGEHLSDEEFIGYTIEALEPPETERLDTHLASCLECATEMERLVEAAEGWDEERLAHIRKRAIPNPWDAPAEPSPPRTVSGKNLQAALRTISSLFIGWQVPVASVAGILVGIALTLLMPRLAEQETSRTQGIVDPCTGP